MTRRGAKHLARLRVHLALLAGILTIAAVTAWLLLPASEDNTTWADHNDHTYTHVAVSQDTICGITTDQGGTLTKKLSCWGNDWTDWPSPMEGHGHYDSLRVGPNFACAFRDAPHEDYGILQEIPNATMQCWGEDGKTEPPCWRIDLGSDFRCVDEDDNPLTEPRNYWDASPNIRHGCWIERHDDDPDKDRRVGCIHYADVQPKVPTPPEATDKGWIVPDKVKNYKFSFVVTGNSTGVTSPGRNGHFAGANHSCGMVLDSDRTTAGNQHEGVVECWGDGLAAVSPPSTMAFKAIEGGWEHNCGIIKDANIKTADVNENEDTVHCWGTRTDNKLEVPGNTTFKEVSAGRTFSCGIVKDSDTTNSTADDDVDTIKCWGNNDFGQLDPAIGKYKSISASGALFADELSTQRLESYLPATNPRGRDYIGRSFACAITIDSNPNQSENQNEGHISCWGDLKNVKYTHYFQDPNNPPNKRPLRPFNFGDALGNPHLPAPTPAPDPRYVVDSISVGRNSNCVLLASGEVSCFGRNLYGEADPPDGVRTESISVGFGHTCGISHHGLHGKNPGDDPLWFPTNTNVVCWGDDLYGQATPPDGEFKTVDAGGVSSCGIKKDGSVVCWGAKGLANQALQTDAPTTKDFVDVKIGYNNRTEQFIDREHACALETDGDVVCWGDSDAKNATDSGETNPPAGLKFKSISAGYGSSCGVVLSDTSDTIKENEGRCWGKSQQYPTATATPTPRTSTDPNATYTPTPTATVVHKSLEDFPHAFVTPTPGVPTFDGTLTTHGFATCGILKADYHNFVAGFTQPPTVMSIKRGANTPYCQGWLEAYGGEENNDQTGKWPFIKIRSAQYFPNGPYSQIETSGYTTCALRANGEVECEGEGNSILAGPPPIATVKPDTETNTSYDCSGTTYNTTTPTDGGRFAATGDAYYVSVPPAALEDDKIVGIHMSEGGNATFSDRSTGHSFSGKTYTANVKVVPDCTDPSPGAGDQTAGRRMYTQSRKQWTLVRLASVQDRKQLADGRCVARLHDLDGLVCAEVDELPVTVAAASMPIPTPTPTPVTL